MTVDHIFADTLSLLDDGIFELDVSAIQSRMVRIDSLSSDATSAAQSISALHMPPVGNSKELSSVAQRLLETGSAYIHEHCIDLHDTASGIKRFCTQVEDSEYHSTRQFHGDLP